MRRQRVWLEKLTEFLNTENQGVYTRAQIAELRRQKADEFQIPPSVSVSHLIKALEETGSLERETISQAAIETSPQRTRSSVAQENPHYKPFVRYLWGEASVYEVALSLRGGSYLSHATAIYFHGLTTQIPRTVYSNKEQSTKPESKGRLTQEAIDRAFKNYPRVSNYVFNFRGTNIVLLSGKNTDNLEVTDILGPETVSISNRQSFPTTKLERTLIDVTVRPTYGSGVFEVLSAYRGGYGRVSIPTLVATLRKLGYVYPYHQAVGFYLERAGYSPEQLQRLRNLGLDYDFYLGNRLADLQYDSSWRIHYPRGLE